MDWIAICKWAAGALAAAIGTGIVIKFTVNRHNSSKSSIQITSQKNNKAGGDIIGGNSVKKTKE